jgi:hypothetical protein
MTEEKKFQIDRFRDVASWMSEIDRRLASVESQLATLQTNHIHDSSRIRKLEEFTASLKVVLNPSQQD